MKKIIWLTALFLLLLTFSAYAAPDKTDFGKVFNDPITYTEVKMFTKSK